MPGTQNIKPLTDELVVPFKELMVQVARGVAEAQRALDEQALEFMKKLYTEEELEELRDAGIQPTWYQIPEVTAKLKVSVSMHSETESTTPTGSKPSFQLFLAPYNATYKNSYDCGFEGTSEMNFKIVPIPPPTAAMFTLVPNLIGMTRADAKTALGSAKLKLDNVEVTGEWGDKEPTVTGQNPEANTRAQVGDPVNIVMAAK